MTTQMSELEIEQWRDKKRYLWLMGLIAPTALFVMMPLVWAFNQWGWHAVAQVPFWIGPILLYILLPALDLRFGPDGQNAPDEVMERLENDKYYRYCTYIYIPFQYASVIFGAYLFTASNLSWLGFDGGLAGRPRSASRCRWGCSEGWASTPRTRWATRRTNWNGGWPRSRWRRRSTATSTSSTTGAITSASRLRRIPRRPVSARRSGSSCRAACGAVRSRRGSSRRRGCAGRARVRGTGPTTCSTPGRCRSCSTAC